jgi:hypothetical protein
MLERFKKINEWIESNPQVTDPNMYEIMDCAVELGKEFIKYKTPNNSKEYKELLECYKEFEKMVSYSLPITVLEDKDSLVRFGTPLYELYKVVSESCTSSEYISPYGSKGDMKKDLLCNLVGVGMFIEKQLRDLRKGNLISKIYDDEGEFEKIKKMYIKYMLDIDYAPQYKQEVAALFNYIEKQYKLSTKQNY